MNWKLNFKRNTNTVKPKKSKTREWVDAIVFAVVVSTVVRGLLFSAYAIPSGSMEGTQLTGDYLFVSKISYGPRMANTPLAIPFTEPTLYGVKTYWDALQLPYLRLPGFTHVKNQDIVVFNKPDEAGPEYNLPVDERTCLIKRCQAIPGDVLSIVNTQVYINGKPSPNAPKQQMSYDVVTTGLDINPEILKEQNITIQNQLSPDTYEMVMPASAAAVIKGYSNIKSVTPVIAKAGIYDPEIFPHNPNFKWNLDNFGPIRLPKKGWTTPLNDSTLTLYRRAIEVYENNKVAVNGKAILINGRKADSYTFKMDYYWMMGDNRHNSLDSRFWGYVPEDHIIGKAVLTWFSTDSTRSIFNRVRWNRVLRPID
ncbi:signal peptidase I [Mucilaginibacter sp. UR6-11]|uniref:signal peptidase I n=1 Tax=Mucilaginibacter sp. UR6-11 TaxID=1435644 RepID=UPI001E35419D|nr:signal peptidase I [Mucilaginibacter sp. UR6-11]MCC8425064.1 signal peptidase I [Mucilaginibacter sp. UR6-11]